MKQIIIVIIAIILISYGVTNLSKPSNTAVFIGLGEIILGLAFVFNPIKFLIKKL